MTAPAAEQGKPDRERSSNPRAVAYAMVGTGLTASVAANVAHGMVSGAGIGAVISGVFWPTGLLLAVEGATRLPWPNRWWWYAVRIGATTPVAAAAAVVSYLHMHGLLGHWHEHWLTQLIGPIAVDGLTTLGAAALLVLDHEQQPTGPVHDDTEAPTGPAQRPVDRPTGVAHEPMVVQPTGPAHDTVTCDDSPRTSQDRPKAPVSQDAVDRVLAVVASGQPMGKGAIVAASGLGRSTVTRAVDHLVEVGRLTAIGDPRRPDYVIHGSAQMVSTESAHEVAR